MLLGQQKPKFYYCYMETRLVSDSEKPKREDPIKN